MHNLLITTIQLIQVCYFYSCLENVLKEYHKNPRLRKEFPEVKKLLNEVSSWLMFHSASVFSSLIWSRLHEALVDLIVLQNISCSFNINAFCSIQISIQFHSSYNSWANTFLRTHAWTRWSSNSLRLFSNNTWSWPHQRSLCFQKGVI